MFSFRRAVLTLPIGRRFHSYAYCLDGGLYHSAICYPVSRCPVCVIVNLTQTSSQPTSIMESSKSFFHLWPISQAPSLEISSSRIRSHPTKQVIHTNISSIHVVFFYCFSRCRRRTSRQLSNPLLTRVMTYSALAFFFFSSRNLCNCLDIQKLK